MAKNRINQSRRFEIGTFGIRFMSGPADGWMATNLTASPRDSSPKWDFSFENESIQQRGKALGSRQAPTTFHAMAGQAHPR